MGQSLNAVFVHLIFHVKSTSVAIQEFDQEKVNGYTASVINKCGCQSLQVGCVRDHMHILFNLCSTISLSDFVAKIKFSTNRYINALAPSYGGDFAWQAGYAAFSVSPHALEAAKNYVANQPLHHKDKCFNEEYLMFLKGNHVDYDERFVFSD